MKNRNRNYLEIPSMLMRGGTSKGLFFKEEDLPSDKALRDKIFLLAVGSPDSYKKQIDGVGSATSSTSKIAIVDKSSRDRFDLDYTFGHISIDKPVIDYSGNCGNLSSAVGIFAIESGLIEAKPNEIKTIKIWQKNIKKELRVTLKIDEFGKAEILGDFFLAGVNNLGSPIKVEFMKPNDKKLFPTGRTIDTLDIPNFGKIEATLIDAGNTTVFVDAKDLGLSGIELPNEIDSDKKLLELLELIRCYGAVQMGLAKDWQEISKNQPATPKISIISTPKEYFATNGDKISKDSIHICARIISMGKAHHAYTGTGAIATAVAGVIPNTIVSNAVTNEINELRIGHSAGVISVGAEVKEKDGEFLVERAFFTRTARVLMKGQVIIPKIGF